MYFTDDLLLKCISRMLMRDIARERKREEKSECKQQQNRKIDAIFLRFHDGYKSK